MIFISIQIIHFFNALPLPTNIYGLTVFGSQTNKIDFINVIVTLLCHVKY